MIILMRSFSDQPSSLGVTIRFTMCVHSAYNKKERELAFKLIHTRLCEGVSDDAAVPTWNEGLRLHECRLLAESFHELALAKKVSLFPFAVLPTFFVASGRKYFIGQPWTTGIEYPVKDHVQLVGANTEYALCTATLAAFSHFTFHASGSTELYEHFQGFHLTGIGLEIFNCATHVYVHLPTIHIIV
ncbi:hypothetical protein EYR40_001675 [Pleurotus pulmonarius]|nr:hypothetical protein EYR40_001675 [Pleurotus pulmonarius]